MIASLADQPGGDGPAGDGPVGPGSQGNGAALPWATSLAIALGANLGDPFATLVAVRPLLRGLLERLLEELGPAGSLLGSQASGSLSPDDLANGGNEVSIGKKTQRSLPDG